MNSMHPKTEGFTLVEFLLYIAISSSVLLLATLFLGMSLEAKVKNQTITEVEQQGALALEILLATVRISTTIVAPLAGATGSSLSLTVPTVGESPTVFSISSGQLRVQKGAAAPVSLTSNTVSVSNLVVENLSGAGTPGTVRVQITVSRSTTSGRSEYVYSKTFTGSASLRHP